MDDKDNQSINAQLNWFVCHSVSINMNAQINNGVKLYCYGVGVLVSGQMPDIFEIKLRELARLMCTRVRIM